MISKAKNINLFQMLFKQQYFPSLRKLTQLKSYSTGKAEYIYTNTEDEYSKIADYPQVEPVTPEYLKWKETQAWYDKIKRQKTVEEKIFEINIPRYWGWKCLLLKEGDIPFNSLDFTKFITRTHLIKSDQLPGYQDSSFRCYEVASHIKDHLEILMSDIFKIRQKYKFEVDDAKNEEKKFVSFFINEINRLLLKFLYKENMDLGNHQADYNPRMESFWHLGSLRETFVPEVYHHGLPRDEIPEDYLGRPSDKYIQYIGNPLIQIRSKNPLPPVINPNEALYFQYPVPIYEYDPFVVFDSEMVRRHVTNIPGFWPGEPREFSFLSYHDINHIKYRPGSYGEEDANETLQCQAISASFAWLMALASFQGFTTFHDVTYPFVTQTILTDGREFSFAVYQLNTTELHHEDPLFNPKCNICWITPKMPLYNVVDGEIKDVNIDVLKMLVQFYLQQTEVSDKIVRKPYLGDDIKVIADYEDDEKRNWLENSFKHFSSNRPRHRKDMMYEAADFEKIYKIQFRKIISDKRSRPFELRENPYLRKMSDHIPEYIPRAIRPDGHLPKYKQQKYRKTFYPE